MLLSQGWASGKLDVDGKPTENGTPSALHAFSLYIQGVTYLGDKMRISVVPSFSDLSDEDKSYIAGTVQNLVNYYTNHIPYTTLYIDGVTIGHSKVTDSSSFKWN